MRDVHLQVERVRGLTDALRAPKSETTGDRSWRERTCPFLRGGSRLPCGGTRQGGLAEGKRRLVTTAGMARIRRETGAAAFVAVVVISWAAIAWAAVFSRKSVGQATEVTSVVIMLAAAFGVVCDLSSARLSPDGELGRLYARRDAVTLVAAATYLVAANTLLGAMAQAAGGDLGAMPPAVSEPATMAGLVAMLSSVASMAVLAALDGAIRRRLAEGDGRRMREAKRGEDAPVPSTVTSYDVARRRLASMARQDDGATADGDVVGFIPLSQMGITVIGSVPGAGNAGVPRKDGKRTLSQVASGNGRKAEAPKPVGTGTTQTSPAAEVAVAAMTGKPSPELFDERTVPPFLRPFVPQMASESDGTNIETVTDGTDGEEMKDGADA